MKRIAFLFLFFLSAAALHAQSITLATYNLENFKDHFAAFHFEHDSKQLADDPAVKELLADERHDNDKSNWTTALVLTDPKVNADVVVLQECCGQKDLEYFNKHWLNSAYATVIVFPTNTTRDQNLAMLLKPGFTAETVSDDYYKEPDPAGANGRGDRLFARGPAFVKVHAPSGYVVWIGTTHQKSKGGKDGSSPATNAWRAREAKRTHEIMLDLEHKGPSDVILMGDTNDELGLQQNEAEGGGDATAALVGPPADGFVLATKSLIDAHKISYGGMWKTEFRSFIDQVIASKSLAPRIDNVSVFSDGVAKVSSDHYPVVVKLHPPS